MDFQRKLRHTPILRQTMQDFVQSKKSVVRVCEAQRSNESPSGAFKRPNGLAVSKMEGPRPDKFAFAQRSGAMKAPVGLLSDRTVLRKQDGGATPRQVRVCVRIGHVVDGCRPIKGCIKKWLYESANKQPELSAAEEATVKNGGFRASITKRQLPVTKPLWEKQLSMVE